MLAAGDFPDWWWDSFESFDDADEEYLGCALCSHDMNNECGIGERDYFEPGRHICVCCTEDEPDPNELQPS